MIFGIQYPAAAPRPSGRVMAPRVRHLAVGLALGGLAASTPASAGDWSFDPVLTLTSAYSTNVRIADSIGAPTDGDTLFRGVAELALNGRSRIGSFGLMYRPTHEIYLEDDELDNTAHFLGLDWSTERTRKTSWSVVFSATERDSPSISLDPEQPDLVAAPRSDTLRIEGSVGANWKTGARSSFGATAGWSGTEYDQDIPGLADSSSVSIDTSWEQESTKRGGIRIGHSSSAVDAEERGEYDEHRLIVGWRRGIARRSELRIDMGGSITTYARLPMGVVDPEDSFTSFIGRIGLKGPAGRRGAYELDVSRDVGDLSGVGGSSRWSSGGGFRIATGNYSSAGLFVRFAQQDPLVEAADSVSTDTFSFNAEWAAALGQHFSIVLNVEQVNQRTPDPNDILNIDYGVYGVGLRWSRRPSRADFRPVDGT